MSGRRSGQSQTPRCETFSAVGAGVLVLALGVVGCGSASNSDQVLHVAAASCLREALTAAAAKFEAATGTRIVLTFGASGRLGTQIERGAPFDLFLSADQATVDGLVERGRIRPDSLADYALGSLVLLIRSESTDRALGLSDLQAPGVRNVAIAEPEVAPYGRAAKQTLETAGLWEALQPKIVMGRSAEQALQYFDSGAADAALVPASLVPARSEESTSTITPIDLKLHEPIRQRLGILTDSSRPEAARAFAAFLVQGPGRDELEAAGFRPIEVEVEKADGMTDDG